MSASRPETRKHGVCVADLLIIAVVLVALVGCIPLLWMQGFERVYSAFAFVGVLSLALIAHVMHQVVHVQKDEDVELQRAITTMMSHLHETGMLAALSHDEVRALVRAVSRARQRVSE